MLNTTLNATNCLTKMNYAVDMDFYYLFFFLIFTGSKMWILYNHNGRFLDNGSSPNSRDVTTSHYLVPNDGTAVRKRCLQYIHQCL